MTPTDERRLVTVLFADIVGFSRRAEESDPEAMREMQRAYFAAASAEIERFGGTVEKFIGDAVMAVFGAPVAHDDDAERALRAALSIRDAIGRLDAQLEIRIGVNTGEVVGGMGAGPQSGDYTVTGDAVNVAARLQQSGAPSEILVGGTTRALAAAAFAFAPLTEMTVKGRTEPIEAWRLERELPERPRTHGGEARLVGRERELASLEYALEEAVEGRGVMVAVVGEPGIGKSRLALEIRQRADAKGFSSAWTSSRSYASAFPYHLVSQLLPQLLRRGSSTTPLDVLRSIGVVADEPTLERWAAVLDDVQGLAPGDDPHLADLSPAGRQRMLVHAIGALLRAGSAREPMLIVLDDLHWADPASLSVVEELLTVVPELRVVLLATYRSTWSHGWEGRSAYEQLNLRALRPEDARRMATELAQGRPLSAEATDRLLERSAGNPLFLEELLHGERGTSDARPHRLPETIHEMLLARLDALPSEARRTLQLASVVGMEFSEPIVAALADGEADDALRALQRDELIVVRPASTGERTFAFRHPLIQEVAYRSLLLSTRRSLHGRIGAWLEEHGGEELAAELARHYQHSDDLAKARHYLRLAGERAQELNANREAHGWFTQAAETFADDPERRAEMIEAAAQQSYLLGEVSAAVEQQREAIRLYEEAGAEKAALNAHRWLGRFHWLLGDPRESVREIDVAIDGLERLGPSPELAFAYSFRAQSVMLEPDYQAGEAWARKAIEVAEATDATAALVHAYNNLGFCLLHRGNPGGVDYLRRSVELALEHHLPDDVGRAYANLSGQGTRIFPFPYAESDALLTEAVEFGARTIPDGIFDLWLRSGYGEFLLVTGRWPEAGRVLDAIQPRQGETYLNSEVRSLRAHLAAYRGLYDEAMAIVAGAAEAALAMGDLQAVLPALAALAATQAGLGDDADAVATIRLAIQRRATNPEATISSWFLFEATDTLMLLRAGNPRSPAVDDGLVLLRRFATALAPDAATGAEIVQTEVRRALFGAAASQLGLSPPGFPDRAAALPTLEREHRIFDAARIRLWLGEETGDAAMRAQARATFEELGAHPYVTRTQVSERTDQPSQARATSSE